jgi:hypothetical protein
MIRRDLDKSGIIGIIVVVVVVILIIIALFALFLAPLRTVQVNESEQSPMTPDLNALELNLTIDVGGVEVRFVDNSNVAASVDVVGERRTGWLGSQAPVNLTWSTATEGSTLVIRSSVNMGDNTAWFSNSDIRCYLNISSQLPTSLAIMNSLGAIDIATSTGVELTEVNAKASVGAVKVTMVNGSSLSGPMRAEASLGGVDMSWVDAMMSNNASISLNTSAGGIRVGLTQNIELGGNMTVAAASSLGGVEVNMDIRGNTSARVTSQADLGNINVAQNNGFNGTNADLASQNYPSISNFEVGCRASAGGVNLNLSYQP